MWKSKTSLILSDVVAEVNELGEAELLDSLILINVVAEITELWVENSQKINCRDVTSIREGRVLQENNKIEQISGAL